MAKKKTPAQSKAQNRKVSQRALKFISSESIPTPPTQVTAPSISWPPARFTPAGALNYRFLNPYNFVRYLGRPNIAENDADSQLLGRCSPPPHDRYVGLTGEIECSIETVTPLFIADSHSIGSTIVDSLTDKKHLDYRFFQYENQDAIPATSLRGMIRSLFEIVTNSPFTVFDGDERLEYRLEPSEARDLKPGIVLSLPRGKHLGEIVLCDSAKVGAYYSDSSANVLNGDWKCGDKAFAIIGHTKNNIPKVDALSVSAQTTKDWQEGWLKITGPNTIDTKKNEQFFYFKNGQASATHVTFGKNEEEDYNTVLAEQRERKDDFRTIYQHQVLTEGDLIYVALREGNSNAVQHISLVKVARLRYQKAIGELLDEHLHPSTDYTSLDIASRVFGWVKNAHRRDKQIADDKELVAYAGRVSFSHGTLDPHYDKGVYDEPMTLAILGEAKPTTSLFYLRKKNGVWTEEERRSPKAPVRIGYDGSNELRGRKVYRNHGELLNRQEYERAGNTLTNEPIKDHQNRTVRGVRVPGNRFNFTIYFHNLAPVELGALLWTVNLCEDQNIAMRLGYAKPLGFGSVKVRAEDIFMHDFTKRYRFFDQSRELRRAKGKERSDWLNKFAMEMEKAYGGKLESLPPIQDLIALLSPPRSEARHIHYPRSGTTPTVEGKNFEWFEENKRKSADKDKAGPNYPLGEADDIAGLPLLRKNVRG